MLVPVKYDYILKAEEHSLSYERSLLLQLRKKKENQALRRSKIPECLASSEVGGLSNVLGTRLTGDRSRAPHTDPLAWSGLIPESRGGGTPEQRRVCPQTKAKPKDPGLGWESQNQGGALGIASAAPSLIPGVGAQRAPVPLPTSVRLGARPTLGAPGTPRREVRPGAGRARRAK